MQRLMKKKGFTLVELVVVIAIIAVLAAVLIPTFTGIIRNANRSADSQAVRQMSTVLSATEMGVKSLEEAVDLLEENGYAANNLTPLTRNTSFFWHKDLNIILLINVKDNTLVFPENEKIQETLAADLAKEGDAKILFNLFEDGAKYIDVVASNQRELKNAFANGTKNITLDKDITLKEALTLEEGAEVVIDLNGKTLDANYQRPFIMSNGSKLTVEAAGATVNCNEYGFVNIPAEVSAEVVINGGTFNATLDNGAFIKLRAGGNATDTVKVTLNNVTYTDITAEDEDNFIVNKAGFSGKFDLEVNGGSYNAPFGFQIESATFNGATIVTGGYAICCDANAANVTVDACKITVGTKVENSCYAAALVVTNGSTGTIKNSTINFTEGTGEQYAYAIYPTGGTITAINNTNNTYKINDPGSNAVADGVIIIDGVRYAKTR